MFRFRFRVQFGEWTWNSRDQSVCVCVLSIRSTEVVIGRKERRKENWENIEITWICGASKHINYQHIKQSYQNKVPPFDEPPVFGNVLHNDLFEWNRKEWDQENEKIQMKGQLGCVEEDSRFGNSYHWFDDCSERPTNDILILIYVAQFHSIIMFIN